MSIATGLDSEMGTAVEGSIPHSLASPLRNSSMGNSKVGREMAKLVEDESLGLMENAASPKVMRVEVVGAGHRSAVGPRSEEKMVGKLS